MHDVVKPPYCGFRFPTAYSDWGAEEHEAVQRVIASGKFTMGPEVAQFEEEFASYHRMKYGIMVNSGSSANLIMIAALMNRKVQPLRRHDFVMVPALAWSTTYAPLIQLGLRIKLADCDDTWNAAPTDVQGMAAVIGCSILGNPAALDFFQVAIESHGGYFLEDNCEALGAQCGNMRTGTFGLMNSFSFFYSHQISAIEGGMILTNDAECNKLCRILRAHGWTRDVELAYDFNSEYNFTHFGYNVRPLEMHAAVASVQLRRLKTLTAARLANWKLFEKLTAGLPVKLQAQRGAPSPFGLPFMVSSSEVRLELVRKLRERGIDCRLPTGGSMTRHEYGAPWRLSNFTPNADRVHDLGLFLGNGPLDLTEQITVAVGVMKEVLA